MAYKRDVQGGQAGERFRWGRRRYDQPQPASIPFTPQEAELPLSAEVSRVVQRLRGVPMALTLDIDETLEDSTRRWNDELNAVFYSQMGLLAAPIVYEEMVAKGGTNGSFGQHPDIPPEIYLEVTQQRLRSEQFNSGLPLVDPVVPTILQQLHQTTPAGMYLTARPDAITKVTQRELLQKRFPTAPVIARPDQVSEEDVSAWKYAQLLAIAAQSRTHLVMIDDSVSLADYIASRKERVDPSSPEHRIHALVYKGVRTGVTNGHQTVERWDDMPAMLETIRHAVRTSLR